MIEFEQLKVRNFLSYGNNETVLKFDKGLNRFIGTNGRGKSAIVADSIIFALFGKV